MSDSYHIPRPAHRGYVKVPVVMQMEALECGAASLTMILAYYKKFLPLEQVRADCGVSRDGSSAKNILIAARSYGMTAKAYRYDPETIMQDGTFPCIIHWNMNHFVVLNGFQGKHAIINDPARGCVKVTLEEFDASFTGITLIITPNEDFVPGGKPRSVVAYALSRLHGTGLGFALIICASVISILLQVLKPSFSRIFLDRILTGKNPEWLYPLTLSLILLAVVDLVMMLIKKVYLTKVEAKLAIISNSGFMWHILHLPMEFFSQRMSGDIADRQSKNETISSELMNTFAPLALDLILIFIYLVVMLRYSVLLTVVGVTAILINSILSQVISRKRVNITRVQMRNAGTLVSMTANGIRMIESLKASGSENGYFEKWAGYQANVNTQTNKFSKLNQLLGSVPALIISLSNVTVLILGVYLTMLGKFSVGMILAFQGFMSSMMTPVQKMITSGQELQETQTNMERIEDVTNYPLDDEFESDSPA
ncbi:MAG: NHLP family bacteriocin export ABC transporter peptidase/permease/ATPase, partial [Oscillospiraceae bacterium]|nr:NHLP family bacteriocin export ABC transporter peptidase/permease/ATPase [Oscillospiraceae bacterium]